MAYQLKDAVPALCGGNQLMIQQVADLPLFVPQSWASEVIDNGFIEVAAALMDFMTPASLAAPWIISSAKRDLWGNERVDSASHMEGRAFDLSPMYSWNVVIPDQESATISGLAWNLMSLIALLPCTESRILFFVEGDHLHVEPSLPALSKTGYLMAVWTAATWYGWTKVVDSDPLLSRTIGSAWVMTARPLLALGPSDGARRLLQLALDGQGDKIDPVEILAGDEEK